MFLYHIDLLSLASRLDEKCMKIEEGDRHDGTKWSLFQDIFPFLGFSASKGSAASAEVSESISGQ